MLVFFGGTGSSGVSVNSARETPSSRANPIRLFRSGAERSVSHLLTACRLTPNRAPSSS